MTISKSISLSLVLGAAAALGSLNSRAEDTSPQYRLFSCKVKAATERNLPVELEGYVRMNELGAKRANGMIVTEILPPVDTEVPKLKLAYDAVLSDSKFDFTFEFKDQDKKINKLFANFTKPSVGEHRKATLVVGSETAEYDCIGYFEQ